MYRAIYALLMILLAVAALAAPITHDWPMYIGPNGTFADTANTPLLDDFSKATLAWKSGDTSIGWGKSTSQEGALTKRAPGLYPSGQGSLIVAGGLVIAGYFIPSGDVIDKSAEGVAPEFRQRALISADDVILAVDAATGKTQWKQVFAGKGINRGHGKRPTYGPTPAAADGKVFHLGTTGRVYCVDLQTGAPLWESNIGAAHKALEARKTKELTDRVLDKDEGPGMITSLVVCDETLLVPVGGNLFAFDVATGTRRWESSEALSRENVPCPVMVEGKQTLFCVNARGEMRLIDPKSGKVLWMKASTPPFSHTTQPLAADGKAFLWKPLTVNPDAGTKVVTMGKPACYTLKLDGATLLWELPDEDKYSMVYDAGPAAKIGYRDGVVYFGSWTTTSIVSVKAEDGKVLARMPAPHFGQFHLWGDKLVLIGDNSHESMGLTCTYTPYTLDLKRTGNGYEPRSKQGVSGYILPLRDPFADGFQFTRSTSGQIWCWDLRARAAGTKTLKLSFDQPLQGLPKQANVFTAEGDLDKGKLAQLAFSTPVRGEDGAVGRADRQITLKDAIDLTPGTAEWTAQVPVQREDLESWKVSLKVDGKTVSGSYERQVPALSKIATVEGIADAKTEAGPNNTQRWIITFSQLASRDVSAVKADRKDLYIVVQQSPTGETEAWARCRTLNKGTHEVQITRFEPGAQTLVLKGTILMHADAYVSASTDRAGTVAVNVDVALKLEDQAWKGTYTAQTGVAWSCTGPVTGEIVTQ